MYKQNIFTYYKGMLRRKQRIIENQHYFYRYKIFLTKYYLTKTMIIEICNKNKKICNKNKNAYFYMQYLLEDKSKSKEVAKDSIMALAAVAFVICFRIERYLELQSIFGKNNLAKMIKIEICNEKEQNAYTKEDFARDPLHQLLHQSIKFSLLNEYQRLE